MNVPRMRHLPEYYEGKKKEGMKKGGEVKSEPYTPDERPTINFDSTELPELKDWKVGESYPVLVHVKQVSVHTIEHGNKKGKVEATFKVEKVAYCPKEEEEQEEDFTDVEDGYKKGGTVTSTKAKEILRDGTAQGHKLTDKQKRYFGFIAGGGSPKRKSKGGYADGGEITEKVIGNAKTYSKEDGGIKFIDDSDTDELLESTPRDKQLPYKKFSIHNAMTGVPIEEMPKKKKK